MKELSIRQLIQYPDKFAQELNNDSKDGMLLIIGNKRFVILAEREYNSIYETQYLMSTKANAQRLLEGVDQAQSTSN